MLFISPGGASTDISLLGANFALVLGGPISEIQSSWSPPCFEKVKDSFAESVINLNPFCETAFCSDSHGGKGNFHRPREAW